VTVGTVLPNEPFPTGNVNVDWFLNGDCSGAPASSSGPLGPLNASGQFDATTFAFTVNAAGMRSFRANYLGGGNGALLPSTGACEPLQVVDANIQITPATAQNPLNTNHTLTGHVNVNSGAGFVNAPDGTTINFSIQSGPGSFVGGVSTCNTAGGTGSCTVQITSGVAGTTVVRASTDVTVLGAALHRETGDANAGDSADAQKEWVGGGGQITPTAVSCSDFASGTAPTLDQVNYKTGGNPSVIQQGINPGVFFFYTKVTTTVPNQVVTVSQTNTSTNNSALFAVHQGQARLYPANCSSFTTGTLISGDSGASFTIPVPGNYILGLKYDTKSLSGTKAPVPADITFNFATSLGGATGGSLLLKKQ